MDNIDNCIEDCNNWFEGRPYVKTKSDNKCFGVIETNKGKELYINLSKIIKFRKYKIEEIRNDDFRLKVLEFILEYIAPILKKYEIEEFKTMHSDHKILDGKLITTSRKK